MESSLQERFVRFTDEDARSQLAVSEPTPGWKTTRGRARVELLLQEYLPAPLFELVVSRGYYGLRTVTAGRPGRDRVLPDFLIVGAAKCGTTSLFDWLCAHPMVARPTTNGRPRKELLFFDYQYQRGADWYRSHFPLKRERTDFAREHGRPFVTGEATASYLTHPWVPARVAALTPRAKIIVMLRDPVDRAYSAFQMSRREELEPCERFEDALALEDARLAPELERLARKPHYNPPRPPRLGYWSYLHRSRYAEHVARWLEHFPREQMLFVNFADLAGTPQRTLDAVHAFLELPPHRSDDLAALNTGSYGERMEPETRAYLTEYFRPHNARLYELTGTDFGWPS